MRLAPIRGNFRTVCVCDRTCCFVGETDVSDGRVNFSVKAPLHDETSAAVAHPRVAVVLSIEALAKSRMSG